MPTLIQRMLRKIVLTLPEWLVTAVAFLYGITRPVYRVHELPEGLQARRNLSVMPGTLLVSPPHHLSLLSWNILRYYHRDEIAVTISQIFAQRECDVAFIQEAPVYRQSRFADIPLFAGWHSVYAPLHHVLRQGGRYTFQHSGNLIVSRLPFIRTDVYELPTVSESFFCNMASDVHFIKRIAVYGQILSPHQQKVGLYNVHLENLTGPRGRGQQLQYLLDIIQNNDDDIVIIGGDFNTVTTRFFERGLRFLTANGFMNVFSQPQFRWRLLPRLDYWFVRGVPATGYQLSGRGSDHQPIFLEVQW